MIKNTDKIKIPKLRFPEFEGEWDRRSLLGFGLDVIDGDRGGNYPNGDDFSPVGYCLFLNAKNVTKAGFTFDQTSFIAKEKDEALRKGKLNRNDLVLTTRGTVGNIAYYDDSINYPNVRINSGMVIIRNKTSKINSQFVYIYFFAPVLVKQMKVIAFGSAQPQLTVKEIHKINLSLPTLPEQEKIASFLSSVDKKIQQLTRKKELLEKYKKGVMQRIFAAGKNSGVKGKGKSVKLNTKNAFAPIRFKDEDGNDYPDWEEKRLGNAADINPKTSNLPDQFVYIDLESVVKRRLLKEDVLERDHAPSRAQRLLEKKDILFQTVRPYQMNNLFFDLDGEYVASTGYAQIRAKGNPQYLFQLLHTESFVNDVINRCTGSNYPAINSSDLKAISVDIPTLDEQKKIAAFLSDIDNKIESVNVKLIKTQSFKKGLLQQMFV